MGTTGTISRSWLDVSRGAWLEPLYRNRSVLCVGIGDGAGIEVLLRRGARHVIGLTSEPQAITRVQERLEAWRGRFELHTGTVRSLPDRFDVVLVADALQLAGAGPGASWQEVLNALCQHVQPEGWLVAAAPAAEGGAGDGVGYYELADSLADDFPAVTMLGQTPLQGVALAPFGEDEVEPVLDAGLVEPGLPSIYVAVAGPRRLNLGYGVVLLPPEAAEEEISAEPARLPAREPGIGQGERAELAELRAQQEQTRLDLLRLEEERAELVAARERMEALRRDHEQRLTQEAGRRAEVEAQLATRERALEELREAGLQHAREMQQMRSALDERDAYIAELEQGARTIDPLRAQLREAGNRAAEAEAKERAARRRAAELEGAIMRLERERAANSASVAPASMPAAPAPTPAVSVESSASVAALEQQVAELRTQLDKQKVRADELQREAWGHLKARSEAEASAAEVREDTVRKLKDARKVANLELMRAMEEATKKAVALKEELVRCERERKDAVAALKQAREQTGASEDLQRELNRLKEENAAIGGERERLLLAQQEAERELGALRAVREELGRAQAELGELRAQQAGIQSQGGAGPGSAGQGSGDVVGGERGRVPGGEAGGQELAGLHETLLRVERRNGELEEELARVRLALLRMPPDLQISALEQRNRELEDELLQLRRRLEPALHAGAEGSAPGFEQPGQAGHGDSRRGDLERMETTLEREMVRLGMIEEGLRRVGEAIAAASEVPRPFNGEPE